MVVVYGVPLLGSRGGGGMAYMAMVNIRDSIQGVVKIRDIISIQQSIGKA